MTSSRKKVIIFLLAADLFLTLLHLLWAKQNPLFHLDVEHNLPTYYQGLKLIIFGCVFFAWYLHKKQTQKLSLFSLPLSLGMILIGIDEVLEIHENIYRLFEFTNLLHPERVIETTLEAGYRSSIWIIYYLPIIFMALIWFGYWLRHFQTQSKTVMKLLIVAAVLLLLVFVMEVLSSSGVYSDETYFWLITVEETVEAMFGTMLVAIGFLTLGKGIRDKAIDF